MSENLKTTYVSQLDEITDISADDFILVSQLNQSESSTEYASKKISYGNLSTILVGDVDEKIRAGIDDRTKELSDAISANYDAISALAEKEKSCESAIIKVANCVNQAKHDIQVLSSRICAVYYEDLNRDECLCTAIDCTSSYLSSAIRYVSGQVDSTYSGIDSDVRYLSSQHQALSSQLSTQISSKILQLSSCVSSVISSLSVQISSISGGIDSTLVRINQLENQVNDLDIKNYDTDIANLNFHMFEEGGRVEALSADVENIRSILDGKKYVKFFGIFSSFDDIGDTVSEMSEGDIIVVGNTEYYLDDRGSLCAFGNETSAQYWNKSYNTVNSLSGIWNDTATSVSLSAQYWNEVADTYMKISVLTKNQLTSITDPDSKTLYFCTDS